MYVIKLSLYKDTGAKCSECITKASEFLFGHIIDSWVSYEQINVYIKIILIENDQIIKSIV